MVTGNFVVVFSNSDTHERKYLDTLSNRFSVIAAAGILLLPHIIAHLQTHSTPHPIHLFAQLHVAPRGCVFAGSIALGYPVYPCILCGLYYYSIVVDDIGFSSVVVICCLLTSTI